MNKYTCTGIDFILEKNNTWALFIIQTRNLSNSFDKANQDSRAFCPRLLFLVPVYYVKNNFSAMHSQEVVHKTKLSWNLEILL